MGVVHATVPDGSHFQLPYRQFVQRPRCGKTRGMGLARGFFSEPDISPCAAVWAPAVGFAVGLQIPQSWFIEELTRRPELLAAYRDAAAELTLETNAKAGRIGPDTASPSK